VPEEARIGLDEQVMLEGEELAVFEGFEAVENEGSAGKDLGTHVSMEEETVPPEPANRPIDGRRRDLQVAGDLPIGHAAHRSHEKPCWQIGPLEPVRRREGLGAKATPATQTCKALHQKGRLLATVESGALPSPKQLQVPVMQALGIRAEGWNETPLGVEVGLHALRLAGSGPDQISTAQPSI